MLTLRVHLIMLRMIYCQLFDCLCNVFAIVIRVKIVVLDWVFFATGLTYFIGLFECFPSILSLFYFISRNYGKRSFWQLLQYKFRNDCNLIDQQRTLIKRNTSIVECIYNHPYATPNNWEHLNLQCQIPTNVSASSNVSRFR